MLRAVDIEGCTSGGALSRVLGSAPAAVVHVRALAVATMFPNDLREALDGVPYEIAASVAPPEVLHAVGVKVVRLGDTLVFVGGRLVGRVTREDATPVGRVLGLLRASLSPWLGKKQAVGWDDDDASDADPFVVLGVPASASFEEVHAAWRAKLAEYHPDRFARAGEKIRQVALSESQRLNAAFRAIAERRGRKLLS